jgi:hypothetical protein
MVPGPRDFVTAESFDSDTLLHVIAKFVSTP